MSRALGALLAWGLCVACEPAEDAPAREQLAAEADDAKADDAEGGAVAEAIGTMHWLHLVEIERGELAKRRASQDEVRTFAERIARDHRHLDRRLLRLARRMGVRPGAARRLEVVGHAAGIEKLRELHGIELDRAYLKAVIDSHDKMIGRLIDARALSDEVLEQAVRSRVLLLEQHRDLAFRLLTRMPIA